MDDFLDAIVVRKKKKLFNILYYLVSFLMILSGIATIFFLFKLIGLRPEDGAPTIDFFSILSFAAGAGLTFLLFWLRAFMRIDYDICITNGFVEIERVVNNVKRIQLYKFHMNEVEAGGYTTSSNFKRYESMKNIKKYKAVLNSDEETYFLYVKIKDKAALVIFEANQDLIKLMYKYNPRTVKLKK